MISADNINQVADDIMDAVMARSIMSQAGQDDIKRDVRQILYNWSE
jgi:hypothetical protein